MEKTLLQQVEQAINRGKPEEARELLREELVSNPTAEAYYLASQVALDARQQREFLEKALEIYPFHKKAYFQLEAIDSGKASSVAVGAPAFVYAPISKRFVAYLIDAVLLWLASRTLLTMIGFFITLPPETMPSIYRGTILMTPNPSFVLINFTISTVISALYFIYFLTEQDGQTPGKRLRGIKVISLTGDKITRRQAFIRNVIGYWISGLFLIGFLWPFWDKQRQAWHDKFAKTIVIKAT